MREKRRAYSFWWRRLEKEKKGRARLRWEDNVKTGSQIVSKKMALLFYFCTQQTQVNTITNFGIHKMMGISWTLSYWTKSLSHRVVMRRCPSWFAWRPPPSTSFDLYVPIDRRLQVTTLTFLTLGNYIFLWISWLIADKKDWCSAFRLLLTARKRYINLQFLFQIADDENLYRLAMTVCVKDL
jgi:hypothetical protein